MLRKENAYANVSVMWEDGCGFCNAFLFLLYWWEQ